MKVDRKTKRTLTRSRAASSWHVYLVRCSDDTFYCGITNNLTARIAAHCCGKGAKYTRSRGPVTLVWKRRCRTKSNALKLEYRIKQLTRLQKERLITSALPTRLSASGARPS